MEKGGRKNYVTERNGRSSCEWQGIVEFCTHQWNERNVSSSGTTESCVCTTEDTSVPNTGSTTTTTVNTHTCEPCDCTPGTPESSSGILQEIIAWVHLVIHWFSGTHLCMHVYVIF